MLLALAAPAHPTAAQPAPEALMPGDDEAVRRGFTRTRKTIPIAFRGDFNRDRRRMRPANRHRPRRRPTSIRRAGKEGDVQEVRVEGPRKILVTFIYGGGGEFREKTKTVLLGRDGHSVAFQLESGPYTRVRCGRTERCFC